MKTFSANSNTITRDWLIIDAANLPLGRLATQVAHVLKGKHKAEYTPHVDTGDYVVVINAGQVTVTGNKAEDKIYHRHTGYPGGLKSVNFKTMQETHPGRVVEKAVKGMLPKNPLGRQMFRKLKVYAGSEHPHEAQQPRVMTIKLKEETK